MPVYKDKNGKYKIGTNGKPIYDTMDEAESVLFTQLNERVNKLKEFIRRQLNKK